MESNCSLVIWLNWMAISNVASSLACKSELSLSALTARCALAEKLTIMETAANKKYRMFFLIKLLIWLSVI
jgi:hypothetical protein